MEIGEKTQQRQAQSLDTNKQSLVFLGSSEHWLWWEGETFLALRALALEDWSKLGLGVVMRSTPARPQPYTHSWEMVRNDTAHLIGGSLDCPSRWRGRSQHCSSSVVGRPPPSGPRCCRGDSQAAPQNGTATGLGQGGGVEEDARPARVNLRGTSVSLLKMARSVHFQMFHSPDSAP